MCYSFIINNKIKSLVGIQFNAKRHNTCGESKTRNVIYYLYCLSGTIELIENIYSRNTR